MINVTYIQNVEVLLEQGDTDGLVEDIKEVSICTAYTHIAESCAASNLVCTYHDEEGLCGVA